MAMLNPCRRPQEVLAAVSLAACLVLACSPAAAPPLIDTGGDVLGYQPDNPALAAAAGQDQTVEEGTGVLLDGSASFDLDGDVLTFLWVQTEGPAVELLDASTASAHFFAPQVDADTRLAFTLSVTDGENSATDEVTVMVLNVLAPTWLDPELAISASATQGTAPLTVTFEAGTVDGQPLPDGTVTWQFGDGTMAEGLQVTHTYLTAGSYIVTMCLAVGSATSCSQTKVTATTVFGPVVQNQAASTAPGIAKTLTLSGSHPNDLNLTFSIVSGPANGSLGAIDNTPLNAAIVVYTPNPGFTGTDSFVFKASDGTAESGNATYTISVTDIASGVTAEDVFVTTNEDTATVVTLAGADPDGQNLTFSIVSGPAHGSLGPIDNSPVNSATATYTPAADYFGADSFTFIASDGAAQSPPATVTISITPINDAPSFTAPGDRAMAVNSTLQADMSLVSAGPANENTQTVSFSATSSNQAVIPDTGLSFSGSRLRIASGALAGQVTITVTAADNGGRANGGQNSAQRQFRVTVISGPMISGTLSLTPTVGARPKIGLVGLKLAGSNGHPDYQATTDVDGRYSALVNDGWTGTIEAADPAGCIFTPERTAISSPLTSPLVGQDIRCWRPPIGIPMPEFGIKEAAPTYNQADPLHYYVDNSVQGATDSANPNGSPAKPRVTIPGSLQAGAYVEVHGGPYAYGSGYIQITGQGTTSRPIVIAGVGTPRFDQKLSVYGAGTGPRYMIFQGLSLYKWECIAPASYVVLRNCDIHGDQTNGGAVIASFGTGVAHHILIHNNVIHDNGNWLADYDQDVHGIVVTANVNNVWILDNEMYHNSGDGLQINAASLQAMPTTHHVYVGRNSSHENKQAGLWTKQAVDVIFSQNVCHTLRPIGTRPSAGGGGLGFQYGPERVWFLYNHVYNCCYGISSGSTSGEGDGQDVYLVGNLIHDIHHDPAYAYTPGSAWSNAAITLVGTVNKYLVNNTIHDADAGINTPSGGAMFMENNIISNITDPQGNHVFVEDGGTAGASLLEHCLLYQNGDAIRIRWGDGAVRSLPLFQAVFGKGLTCINANPLFANPAAGDLRLSPGSPAIDSGLASDVYNVFRTRYGTDIQVDYAGFVRPAANGYDIGAYEQ